MTSSASTPPAPTTASPLALQAIQRIFKELYRKPASAIGTSIVVLFIMLAVFGPVITPYTATEQSLSDARQAPSATYFFGTDNLGRDVFSRVIIGSRSILGLAGLGTLLAVFSGTFFGLVSGYLGGWFDEILMRSFDSLLAIPALLLALLFLGTLGPSQGAVLVVIVIVYTPIVARVVRSEVLSLKTRGFVEAARLQGESLPQLLGREILPSVLPALTVEASLRFSYAIFLVASLGFLGVGVQPPSPDWGLMVSEARDFVRLTPWSLFFPAAAISLLVIGVNLMADGLKRALQASTQTERLRFKYQPAALLPKRDPQPVLQLENVTISYRQQGQWLNAVREVSLEVASGQTYALVGESGSGKSTLALAAMRYLAANGVVRSGHIFFKGNDLLALPRRKMERIWGAQMALVPQDPLSSLNPSLTIRQQMTELLQRHQNLTRPQAYHRTLELLTSVNLPDPNRVAASYPHQLSGGQQQRVMIALSLSTDPALLILDEPTTSLDVTTEATMLDLFRRLINDHQTAALYVSHNLGVVARISDRVAVLYAGELVEDASTVELYQQALHPYTQGLLDSVPRLGLNKASQTLPSMSGSIPSLRAIPSGCVFAPRCPIAVERCFEERPSLDVLDSGRKVRCHRWPEIQQGTLIDHKRTATEGHHAAPTAVVNPKKPILAVKNLQKHFANRRLLSDWLNGEPPSVVKAVDDVSFEIPAGQTLALVGESGSGKTTVSRMVMALLADSGGQMELFGVALPAQLKHRDLDTLRQLQMVFQNPEEALNPYFTVAESLRRPLQILNGLSRAEASQRIPGLLDMVRLPAEFAHRLPAQLSGGEKQRVAIARAFAVQPQLVVCDEPVSALDVSVQAAVLNLLNDLQRQQGSAYLFISHDLAVVSYLADHIAVIYLGQLMEIGPTAALLSPPYHPYTEALLSAVPQPDPTHQGQEIRLAGDIPSATNTPSGCPFHTRCPRFVGQVCIDERPPWRTVSPGHRIRCHIPTAELQAAQDEIVS